jgi:hypothetical protein
MRLDVAKIVAQVELERAPDLDLLLGDALDRFALQRECLRRLADDGRQSGCHGDRGRRFGPLPAPFRRLRRADRDGPPAHAPLSAL